MFQGTRSNLVQRTAFAEGKINWLAAEFFAVTMYKYWVTALRFTCLEITHERPSEAPGQVLTKDP